MTQSSRPQAERCVAAYPDSGPYTAAQWAEIYANAFTGDESTTGERAQLRGVVPTCDNKLVVTNAAGVTMTIGTGAAWVNGHWFVNSAAVDIVPTTPAADRIDRVVLVQNNTAIAYDTNLEFPADLTDYNGAASVPAYSCRIAILTGIAGGAMRNLVQSADYWMIELARYTITNVPAISAGPTDHREFAQIEYVVGVHSDDKTTVENALILGTQVDGDFGDIGLGVAVRFCLENDAGDSEDAGQIAARWTDAANGSEDARLEVRLSAGNADNLGVVINAPTAASADGNARGVGAVDLQQTRSAVAQVASGNNSVIGGGRWNTASFDNSTVSGGEGNTASGALDGATTVAGGVRNTASDDGATVGGGVENTASADSATVAGGYDNTTSGNYSTVGGGRGNDALAGYSTVGGGWLNTATDVNATVAGGYDSDATADFATVGGGNTNLASGDCSTVCGGREGAASGEYSSITGGYYATADKYGQRAHAAGGFAAAGDAQGSLMVARRVPWHSDASWYELFLDGQTQTDRMVIAVDTVWTFDILLVGTTQGCTKSFSYRIEGVIENDGGTTSLLASTVTTIYEDDEDFAARVSADDANDALVIEVTDATSGGDVVRWVATVRTSEVTFPA